MVWYVVASPIKMVVRRSVKLNEGLAIDSPCLDNLSLLSQDLLCMTCLLYNEISNLVLEFCPLDATNKFPCHVRFNHQKEFLISMIGWISVDTLVLTLEGKILHHMSLNSGHSVRKSAPKSNRGRQAFIIPFRFKTDTLRYILERLGTCAWPNRRSLHRKLTRGNIS